MLLTGLSKLPPYWSHVCFGEQRICALALLEQHRFAADCSSVIAALVAGPMLSVILAFLAVVAAQDGRCLCWRSWGWLIWQTSGHSS